VTYPRTTRRTSTAVRVERNGPQLNYYNEIDPFAAKWLRKLIDAGHIAPGVVDERSIEDVKPSELAGYTQCHFFAGIGVWSYALRQAGWPDDRTVWTGSCPCQPFSAAGKGKGTSDERHLWPAWFHLIEQCKPHTVFGEQVEAAIRFGWLDTVQTDLEGSGYTFGACGAPAAGVGAPHIRARIYFVAHNNNAGLEGREFSKECPLEFPTRESGLVSAPVVNSASKQVGLPGQSRESRESYWSACEWVPCVDGKARPIEPGSFPLAHGITNRVGRLRGYGNAIVAPVATAFITAFLEGTR
jgi:DNA (cytosine-5)-methyltransferase 1